MANFTIDAKFSFPGGCNVIAVVAMPETQIRNCQLGSMAHSTNIILAKFPLYGTQRDAWRRLAKAFDYTTNIYYRHVHILTFLRNSSATTRALALSVIFISLISLSMSSINCEGVWEGVLVLVLVCVCVCGEGVDTGTPKSNR